MNTCHALDIMGYNAGDDPDNADLKKRFRTLSLMHHPDKGGDVDKFRDINQAYRILIGEEKADDTILPPQSKTDEMFSEVFSGFDELFSKFSGQKAPKIRKKRVCLTIKELFYGAVRELDFVQGTTCSKCAGTGTGSKQLCVECSGAGYFMVDRKTQHNPSFRKIYCTKCKGRGAIGRGSTKMCGGCSGNKMEYNKTRKSIRIPKGVKHNTRIIVGDNTETPTELIVQHPNQTDTEWNGWCLNDETRNIEYTLKIDLRVAMLGCMKTITHPNGKDMECIIPAGVQPNHILIYKDQGLPACPNLKMPPTHANIKLEITIPELKTDQDKAAANIFFNTISTLHASS
jgi:DnaJ family protein A protein 2